jgi:galactokinase
MFAYAPENPEAVVQAINEVGGKGYIIRVDVGTQAEKASLFY